MNEESPLLLPSAGESPVADAEPAAPEPEPDEPAPLPVTKPPFICDCAKWAHSACDGEPFYKEHEGKRYCVLHYPGKEKAADFEPIFQKKLAAEDFNFRGVWFPEAVNFRDYKFNAAVDFRSATFSAEANFYKATFSVKAEFFSATFSAAASFRSAIFNVDAYFDYVTFNATTSFDSAAFNVTANFFSATFIAAASFRSATFSAAAYFDSTIFSTAAYFDSATFNVTANFFSVSFGATAYFEYATFGADVYFDYATFGADASFSKTTFCATTSCGKATFKDQLEFSGSQVFCEDTAFDLQFVRIEKPERVSFHTVALRPHWFVNVDPRKFVFTDVSWNWQTISIDGEIKSLEAEEKQVSSPHRLLAIACRQLAENAEVNNRYEEASRFRYWAMDLARHDKWKGWAFWETGWLHIFYWTVSGYGERILRAFVWLLGVWIIFALLYTQVGFTEPTPKPTNTNAASTLSEDKVGHPLGLSRAITYSLGVMSLQRPEPRPLTNWAHAVVTMEMILGPVQAALLVLAIRRKFMR